MTGSGLHYKTMLLWPISPVQTKDANGLNGMVVGEMQRSVRFKMYEVMQTLQHTLIYVRWRIRWGERKRKDDFLAFPLSSRVFCGTLTEVRNARRDAQMNESHFEHSDFVFSERSPMVMLSRHLSK